MKNLLITIMTIMFIASVEGKSFRIEAGKLITVSLSDSEKPVVHTAYELLERDCHNVFSSQLDQKGKSPDIIIGTVGLSSSIDNSGIDLSYLENRKQAFILSVSSGGSLVIAGSDPHGTAYGIMELTRLIGVSPWEWWADVTPMRRDTFELKAGFVTAQSPSVEYRGIFINDEDWGLMPWSGNNYEPSDTKGHIGPKTNARIFELLLRLRANTYWPAMHECTFPFFMTKGNREVAERFGIYIGGSHCEPMASSTAGEWPRRGNGEFDYVNNSESVYQFWEERVREVAGQEIVYTLGMRGVHDSKMLGAKTIAEQKEVLERAITDQRRLLSKHVDKDIERVPQVFIPYKEVLDIYNYGMEVPEDVTLMWCDDNYGYIRHFPNKEEQERKGGNGIYYHVSYWGRPHDYLWLGTFSPFLLYQQMKLAYDRGIRNMWILNVGDIKPVEYQTELFMDMAWDIENVSNNGVSQHLGDFLEREFGEHVGKEALTVMKEHYRLAYIRKPEFMGNTRVEERTTDEYKYVKDMPWSKEFIKKRLADYNMISEKAESLEKSVSSARKYAYFQLVKYPVQASAQMNNKTLYAQLARHGECSWEKSSAAFDSIATLTDIYNRGYDNQGKWNGIMDYMPRKLNVFSRIDSSFVTSPMTPQRISLYEWNGSDCTPGAHIALEGLGHDGGASLIRKGDVLSFDMNEIDSDSVEIEIRLLPCHPIEGEDLRFELSLDGLKSEPVSFQTKGRSEEWKENVLRNQAIRRVVMPVGRYKTHRLRVKALDEGVVVDRILVYIP